MGRFNFPEIVTSGLALTCSPAGIFEVSVVGISLAIPFCTAWPGEPNTRIEYKQMRIKRSTLIRRIVVDFVFILYD